MTWAVAIYVVNPVGEFMVNDDFAYTTVLEKLSNEETLGPTWLGPKGMGGGPALIFHLLWGKLFLTVFGHSLTALRISVLSMAIMGSIAFFCLLKATNAANGPSFWGTLTLMFNPLYFSQSFTYMTDVTFVSLIIFSFLAINRGIEKNQAITVAIGLLFGLLATLTRQFGILVALAFVIACIIHPRGQQFGYRKALIMALSIIVAPWICFECFLFFMGSTCLTEHKLFHDMLSYPWTMGFRNYAEFIVRQVFHNILGYTAFLVSPVIALLYKQYFHRSCLKKFFVGATMIFIALELGMLLGIFTLPMPFTGNVIFNLGLGPILLKDVYILGIKRMMSIPMEVYYFLVWWSVLCLGLVLPLVWKSVRGISNAALGSGKNGSFLTYLTLIFILMYAGLISLIGIRDRYMIPLCAMLIVFLFSCSSELRNFKFSARSSAPAVSALILIAVFSVSSIHDFMALKRSQTEALNYLTRDLRVSPNHIDGGFEFNGYHCFYQDFEPKKGKSWWWVDREDYVITLGEISGYETVRQFPFRRIFGPDSSIHILKPIADEGQ
ncbi:MAG: glycosyltransferase family 39 protein [Pseudomonadota bacterium]